jgi:hypothetical protein
MSKDALRRKEDREELDEKFGPFDKNSPRTIECIKQKVAHHKVRAHAPAPHRTTPRARVAFISPACCDAVTAEQGR